MLPFADTIAAISTAPGRAGIGIVRLSGPAARSLGEELLRLRHPLTPARPRLAHLLDFPGASSTVTNSTSPAILDEVLVTLFAAPHSYTGEDVLEIAAHGAPVILDTILRAALAHGARLAEPGEFTHRAFLSGRLDLAQAEAVHDLINATTLHQARVAASQLGGALSQQIAPVKRELVTLIATLEAGIDFAEDDLDLLPDTEIASALTRIAAPLEQLSHTFGYGRLLQAGVSLSIVGGPNTGKSSLFNALLGRDRAIVTSVPGTTRDLLSEPLSLDGIPLQLTDTAGLRDTTEEVEALGIARSRTALAEAAAILLVIDASTPLRPEDHALLRTLGGRPVLLVANKLDLTSLPAEDVVRDLHQQITNCDAASALPPSRIVAVSALTGAGLPDLRSTLHHLLAADLPAQDTVIITNLRQQTTITACLNALATAQAALSTSTPHEMLLLDLHQALHALDSLTGATTTDDILQQIFSTFCIGK